MKERIGSAKIEKGPTSPGRIAMDQSERRALEFLKAEGFQNIEYEPDGNVPPDFLVDGHIAVEVRRLNQNVSTEDGFKGLEEDEIPLLNSINKLLHSLGPPGDGGSWFVWVTFKRPLLDWARLKLQIRSSLEAFHPATSGPERDIKVTDHLKLRLRRAGDRHEDRFLLGGAGDLDAGGWVVPEVARNLNLCIAEKWSKIAPVRSRYPKWWLLLLDRISYGSPHVLKDGLMEVGIDRAGWDRIVLIDPTNPKRHYEV
jgi:hypothetical protein